MRTRDTRLLVALLAMLATMAFAVPSAMAQRNSSIDQYIEHVPDAKGGKPAKGSDSKGSNSNSGSQSATPTTPSDTSSGDDSSPSDDSSKSDSKKKHSKKDDKKSDDKSAAPAPTDGDGGSKGGGGDSAAQLALQHVPGASTEPTSSNGGPLLVLIAVVMFAIAGVFAYLRFGRGRRRGTGDAS
jgi:cobalamin biosynthesis Mg chelatase CobN